MPLRRIGLIAATFVAAISLNTAFAEPVAERRPRPKLVVLLVFDQFRGDYLSRWDSLFTTDGFRRLEQGAWFTNCLYPYAATQTGPGHASLSTGCSANRHGIITNEWFDRSSGAAAYCAARSRYHLVYTTPPTDPAAKEKDGGAPDRMLATSFAESLKGATGGKSKVVALSLKDRSAVLPGGPKADVCYWFDYKSGQFVTSNFYRDKPHDWVSEYNRRRTADQWFDKRWTKLRTDIDYEKYSGPDDVLAEGLGIVKKQGRVFPHPMNAGLKQPGKDYYDTVVTSPFGNELLLDFAKHALSVEKFGENGVTDFLSVSFSSNDLVGHSYGPDSQEVLDVTLRSDLIVRDLFNALDERVGKGQYVLAMSADHGVCPMPEISVKNGIDAKRIHTSQFLAKASARLTSRYGAGDGKSVWIEGQAIPWIYLNRNLIAARKLSFDEVQSALAEELRQLDGTQAVYTRAQIESPVSPSDDEALMLLRKCYCRERCGDLALITKPYYLLTTYATGTSHGTPHRYDRHVPLVVFGPGVPHGKFANEVPPQSVVPIFAWAAGISPPPTADAALPGPFRAK